MKVEDEEINLIVLAKLMGLDTPSPGTIMVLSPRR